MKIFRNIGPAIRLYYYLKYLNEYRKAIDYNRSIGDYEEERKQITNATSSWGPRIFDNFGVTLQAEGLENIPEGPVLFVSNHQGYCDIPSYCAAIRNKQFGFVAKGDLGKVPLYGSWIKRIRSILLERDDSRGAVKVINDGIDYLKKGFSLVVFPEGTRSLGENMGTFKKGSLKLATKAEVPVVPVTISGTWKIFEEKGYPQKGNVKFYVHPPIETKGMSKKEAGELAGKVEDIVRKKLEDWNGSI